jgi:uncharacterized protein
MPACPNCRRPAAAPGENRWFPFCSERCKAIDLGRWFGGGYRVPGESVSPDEIPARRPGDDGDEDEPPRSPPRRHHS